MKDFKVSLNYSHIHIENILLDNIFDRIEYHNFLINIFTEIYSLKSDNEISLFIQKYGLNESEKNYQYYKQFLKNYEDHILPKIIFNNLDYKSHLYTGFQNEVQILLFVLDYNLKILIAQKEALYEDFDYVFTTQGFWDRIYIIADIHKRYSWLVDLESRTRNLIFKLDDISIRDFIRKYKLKEYYSHSSSFGFDLDFSSVMRSMYRTKEDDFRIFLKGVILPLIKEERIKIEFEFKVEELKKNNYSAGMVDEEKYLIWEYKYKYIKQYYDLFFPDLKDKILYLNYILYKYASEYNECGGRNENIEKIRNDLKYFEAKLKMDVGKPSSLKKITPKRKQNNLLLKHYLKIALNAEDVPKLNQLATDEFSVPFWSKKFKDYLFLLILLKKIDSMIINRKITQDTRDFYIKLKDDVSFKITKATKDEESKTGQKSMYQNSLNDRFEDDDSFDSSDYPNQSVVD